MTDQFSPSGDAAPIPALPNLVEQKWREFLSVGGFFNPGPTASANEDALRTLIFETIDELSRLRAVVPSPQPETPTEKLKMSDVRVGMRMREPRNEFVPLLTVTEITEKGFKYVLDKPYSYGARYGVTSGGEHYGMDGICLYELVAPVVQDEAQWLRAVVEEFKRAGACPHQGEDGGFCKECTGRIVAALGASRPSPADPEAAAWERLRAIADTPESKLLVEQLWAGFQGRQGR